MKKQLSEDEKRQYIERYVDNIDQLLKDGKTAVKNFKDYVEEGIQADWPEALHAKGYGCYGGNEIYECDWDESLRCIKRLAELTDDPYCYNTMGYIYYYGRCNGGQPEYDKAFKCFSVGHASGIFESSYKLADMFEKGYGTYKSERAAFNMIDSIYNENLHNINGEHYECKYADVALRAGGMFERGCGVEQDLETAYGLYLRADFAIKKRIETVDYYGDHKVQKNISEALERVRGQLPDDYFVDNIEIATVGPVGDILSKSAAMEIGIEKMNGETFLIARGIAGDDDNLSDDEKAYENGKAFICVPEMDYCNMVDSAFLMLKSAEILEGEDKYPIQAVIDGIFYDPDGDSWNMVYNNKVMISFRCSGFVFFGDIPDERTDH